ncbi:MAG: LysR family transcriptional regulator [Burkholderiaceae bacterium]|nr:LysR family transcriptional regulator [Burkholderiaceae bacterium]
MHEVHLFHKVLNGMHPILRRLDLNLLPVFDALLRHRSVTAAASELAMSPSALSHALSRLREALADELFVRIGNAMQPTAYADALAVPVTAALEALTRGLGEARGFDPATSERTFVLAATDYTAFAVLPPLLRRLQQAAPRVRCKVVYSSGRASSDELAAGRIDFCIGYEEDPIVPAPGIESFDWLSDDYVVIAARGHPTIRDGITLAQYLAARHAVVTPWNEASGYIDKVLEKMGYQRDVALHLPSVLAAPFVIGGSELVMTMPHQAALALREAAAIQIMAAPFAIPRYTVKVYGHVRHSRTAAHLWMKDLLMTLRATRTGSA